MSEGDRKRDFVERAAIALMAGVPNPERGPYWMKASENMDLITRRVWRTALALWDARPSEVEDGVEVSGG